jgi:hypothetical protein
MEIIHADTGLIAFISLLITWVIFDIYRSVRKYNESLKRKQEKR